MAVMNPCCCELRLGVTIVALVNMVISMTALIWYTVTLMIGVGLAIAVVAEKNKEKDEHYTWTQLRPNEHDHSDANVRPEEATIAAIGIFLMIITIIFVLSCLVSFVTSIILFLGARKKEIAKCRLWFVITLIFLSLYVIFKIFNIGVAVWALGASSGENTPLIIVAVFKELVALFFSIAIEGYQLWVVYAFMDELKRGESAPSFSFNPSGGIVYYAPKPGDAPPPPYGNPATSYTTGYTPMEGPSPPPPVPGGSPYPPMQHQAYPVMSPPPQGQEHF